MIAFINIIKSLSQLVYNAIVDYNVAKKTKLLNNIIIYNNKRDT